MKRNVRGFTLVEILIVVIILGILAAIVIPQFSNASNDARDNSARAMMKTIIGQIELYKIQHGDVPPDITSNWTVLTKATNIKGEVEGGAAVGPFIYGPYFDAKSLPKNPYNNSSLIGNSDTKGNGWKYTRDLAKNTYTFEVLDTAGKPKVLN